MRTLSSTLEAAQKANTVNALVKLVLTHNATTYTYTKTRILDIKETEDGPLQSLEITLNNSDGTLTDIDLRGYKGVLSTGAVTSAGEEYSACAPMWVMSQKFDSDPNKLTCTLSLAGICNRMADDKAMLKYMPDQDDTKSVKTLIDEIAAGDLDTFVHCQEYEVVWEEGYDDLADTYIPKDAFRVYPSNNRLSAINRLLDYTKNVMVAKADGKLHIFKPTTSGETYDYEYSLDRGQHHFFAKALRNRLTIPNKIMVYSREDDDPGYSGYATDTVSFDLLPNTEFKFTYLESNDQATAIAEAMLAKAQMWCEAGAAPVPMNVGQEVFDYVKVTDSRESDYRIGNIGRIVRNYNLRKNEWTMTFVFGNWQNARKALANLNITADDLENYFSRLQVGDLYAENILADNIDLVWIDPDGTIDLSKIGDNLDNLPDGEVYARVKTLHLDAGGIKLDENIIYADNYDPSTKWTGSDLDDLPDGVTYQRVKSAALTAGGLVLLDQVTAGTYGLVLATDISAGHILLSKCSGDLDDIGDGGTYEKVRYTSIDAGYIQLNSSTRVKTGSGSKWYDEAGVEIDADIGISLFGANVLLFYNASGYYRGGIGAEGNYFSVVAADADLFLVSEDGEIVFATEDNIIRPGGSNTENLGHPTYYWHYVYAYKYLYKSLPASFQTHDDIAMLRAIKHRPDGKLDNNTFPAELIEPDGAEEASRQHILDKLAKSEAQLEKDSDDLIKQKSNIEKLPETDGDAKHIKAKKLKEIGRRIKDNDKARENLDKRKRDTLKDFEEREVIRGIDMANWQSLLMGSILQMADRLDAIEAQLNP